MGRTSGTADISRQEYFDIKRDLKDGHYQADVAEKFGRSKGTISRISRSKTWKTYSQRKTSKKLPVIPAGVSPSLIIDENTDSLLDTNLTKKQAKAFLDMQTDLNLANQDRKAKQQKIVRLEEELLGYRKREAVELMKKARANRSILRFLRRSN